MTLTHKKKVACYDLDSLNRGLHSFYRADKRLFDFNEDPVVGVRVMDIRKGKTHDAIVEALEYAEGVNCDAMIFDLPGGTMEDLTKVTGSVSSLFNEVEARGFHPVMCTVITPDDDATEAAKATMDFTTGLPCTHIVVKNMKDADDENEAEGVSSFLYFDGEEKGFFGDLDSRLRKELGGIVTKMPRIHPCAAPRLKHLKLTFRDAGDRDRCGSLNRRAQLFMTGWLKISDRELTAVMKALDEKDSRPRVYFVVSNKGGVGKSCFARSLTDHLRYA